MFDGGCPLPPGTEIPPMSPVEQLFFCVFLIWAAVSLLSLLLPRPWFKALFKIAYPFMPDKLDDSR
jgi:hypothetical protein